MSKQACRERKPLAPIFRMAILGGAKASVQLHVRLGHDVNAADEKGRSPLMLAAAGGHVELCQLLLEAGADPSLMDRQGMDALAAADAAGRADVVALLKKTLSIAADAPDEMADVRGAVPDPVSETAPPSPEEARGTEKMVPCEGEEAPVAVSTQRKQRTAEDATASLQDEAGRLLPAEISESEYEVERERAPELAYSTVPEPQCEAEFVADPAPRVSLTLGHNLTTQPTVGAFAPEPIEGVEAALDLSGWEEATETPPPPSDLSCAAQAGDIQRGMSQHVPVDTDENWDDIDIDLPEILVSVRRRAKLDDDEKRAVRELIFAALRDGRVQGGRLADVSPRDEDDGDTPSAEFEANLRIVLGDLGVVVDEEPWAPDVPDSTEDDDEASVEDDAHEALAFLMWLNSSEVDTLTLYFCKRPSISA